MKKFVKFEFSIYDTKYGNAGKTSSLLPSQFCRYGYWLPEINTMMMMMTMLMMMMQTKSFVIVGQSGVSSLSLVFLCLIACER